MNNSKKVIVFRASDTRCWITNDELMICNTCAVEYNKPVTPVTNEQYLDSGTEDGYCYICRKNI